MKCYWSKCTAPVTHRVTNKWGSRKVWLCCDEHVPGEKTGTWSSKWYDVEKLPS